eukprot:2162764-Rhodomonas_salina.1
MKPTRLRRTARYDRHQALRYGALLYAEITGIRLHGEGRTWDVRCTISGRTASKAEVLMGKSDQMMAREM